MVLFLEVIGQIPEKVTGLLHGFVTLLLGAEHLFIHIDLISRILDQTFDTKLMRAIRNRYQRLLRSALA